MTFLRTASTSWNMGGEASTFAAFPAVAILLGANFTSARIFLVAPFVWTICGEEDRLRARLPMEKMVILKMAENWGDVGFLHVRGRARADLVWMGRVLGRIADLVRDSVDAILRPPRARSDAPHRVVM